MRAYECSLTNDGKAALLEVLLATEQRLCIRRRDGREKWRLRGGFRFEWCDFWKDEEVACWTVIFGGNFTWPRVLEKAFTEVVATHAGCSWVWPERTPAR